MGGRGGEGGGGGGWEGRGDENDKEDAQWKGAGDGQSLLTASGPLARAASRAPRNPSAVSLARCTTARSSAGRLCAAPLTQREFRLFVAAAPLQLGPAILPAEAVHLVHLPI
ncbi:Protein of unknown function [Gryllus bimaculatus]|nr:Protein of unknown function [Gryllus bimaculatus]